MIAVSVASGAPGPEAPLRDRTPIDPLPERQIRARPQRFEFQELNHSPVIHAKQTPRPGLWWPTRGGQGWIPSTESFSDDRKIHRPGRGFRFHFPKSTGRLPTHPVLKSFGQKNLQSLEILLVELMIWYLNPSHSIVEARVNENGFFKRSLKKTFASRHHCGE